MTFALFLLAGYGLGSIPFSFLVARMFGVRDVRTVGSGNVGATNVMRSAGKFPGVLALILDGSKGAISVLGADHLGATETETCLVGLSAVLGHLFPVFLGFHGGKGVATGAGLFVPLAPLALGISALLFLVTLGMLRYVSLSSIAASLALPLAAYFLGQSQNVVLTASVAALMVVAKHHANVGRLWRGVEPKLGMR